jgi:hypothetical protein
MEGEVAAVQPASFVRIWAFPSNASHRIIGTVNANISMHDIRPYRTTSARNSAMNTDTITPEATAGTQASQGSQDFTEKLSQLRNLFNELAQSAPAAASEAFKELKDKAASFGMSCEEKASTVAKSAVRTVKDHPTQVALAAIGAGALTWWLLSRNRSIG